MTERKTKLTRRPGGISHVRLYSDEEIARLCSRYSYDPQTGAITRGGKAVPAHLAGSGYLQISPSYGGRISYHRLCWILYYRRNPEHVIDHINGDRLDNRIANLRDVTQGENSRNIKPRKDRTTGFAGIWLRKATKWKNYRQYECGKGRGGIFRSRFLCDCVRYRIEKGRKV